MSKLLLPVGIVATIVIAISVFLLSRQETKPQIATSIFPLHDITKNITGDKFEVVNLLPAGASEHTYEPTFTDQQKIASSKLVFAIGLDLDNWVQELAYKSSVRSVEVFAGIQLLEGEEEHEARDVEDNMAKPNTSLAHASEDPDHTHYDPHYWLSLTNGKLIAQNIAKEIITLDPTNKDYYEQNLSDYLVKLDNALIEAKSLSISNSKIITFHEAFAYFAQELGIEIVATIEPFPGKEPSLAYLNEVGELIKQHGVKTLFKEPQLSDAVIKALANDFGATVDTLDPIGGIGERDSYINTYLYNARTVAKALGSN